MDWKRVGGRREGTRKERRKEMIRNLSTYVFEITEMTVIAISRAAYETLLRKKTRITL